MTLTDLVDRVRELLYEGIIDSNWECISEAYQMMSGEKVDIPESEPADQLSINFQVELKNMMERREKLEEKDPPKKKTRQSRSKVQKSKPKVYEDLCTEVRQDENFSKPKKSRKVESSGRNKFDDMQDAIAEAGRETGFDKINDNVKPSERNRRHYKPASVSCDNCGKSFEVNPQFVRENYVCDRCITRRI